MPGIFSNELENGFQTLAPGSLVEVVDGRGGFLGIGTANPHSLITVRLLARERIAVDAAFVRERLLAARELRARLLGTEETVYRACYSEADGLPGLIVDRFADLLVLQSSTAGIDALLPLIVPALVELYNPRAIVAANDMRAREYEGLAASRELVWGEHEGRHAFTVDEMHFLADPLGGQKTGFFLDQRFNRQLLASFIRPGDRVLDLFCYTGGFGLYALHAGAEQVTFVDASETALAMAQEVVERNHFSWRASFLKEDIFPYLKDQTDTFDVVVLDPPALAKSRTTVPAALRAYRDLNARAMAAVKPGGLLATASCSGLVERAVWRDTLKEAAVKAGRRLRIVAQGSQAPDHPILAQMPETEYLKFAVAVVE